MSAYFVTSTGTDIGKTFVTAGLIRYLREAGQAVHAHQAGDERLQFFGGRDQRSRRAAQRARIADRRRNHRPCRALAFPRAAIARSRRRARRPQHRFRRTRSLSAARKSQRRAAFFLSKASAASWCRSMPSARCSTGWRRCKFRCCWWSAAISAPSATPSPRSTCWQPRHLKIAAIIVSESERNPVELDDTVASIARFAHGVGVVGMPRLPGGLNSASGLCQDRGAFIMPASASPFQIGEASRSCLRY